MILITTAANTQRRRRIVRKRNKEKGVERKMPTEMLQAFIGKKVTIVTTGSAMGFEGTIVKIEDNWIMLEGKKYTQIINGDAVNYINIKKEATD